MATETWGTRDLGRAISSVLLGVFSAEGYDSNGLNNTSAGFGGYQECWMGQLQSQNRHPYEMAWPSDIYINNDWDSMGKNWRDAPGSLGAIMLKINDAPDAPRQTICRGRLGTEIGDLPLFYVDEELVPTFTDTIDDAGPSILESDLPNSAVPYFNEEIMQSGAATSIDVKRNIQIPTEPFKPSSLDHLNDSAPGIVKQYIETYGLKLWNVWDIVYPSEFADQRKYLRNFGPIYGSSQSFGPTIRQSGSIGQMQVQVIANRSHATVKRMKPVGYCVGRDATYPWIFPYIDSDGQPNQSIYMSNTACEKVVDFP